MASVEEILAGLKPNQEVDDASDAPDGSDDGSSEIKKVRDWGKNWEKNAKALAKEVSELREFKEQTVEAERSNTVKAVFRELNLAEEQAALYLKLNDGEVTAESIKQFVVDYKLGPVADAPQASSEKKEGFQPGGGGGTAPGEKLLSPEDATNLRKTNLPAFEQALREGRIELITEL